MNYYDGVPVRHGPQPLGLIEAGRGRMDRQIDGVAHGARRRTQSRRVLRCSVRIE